MFVRRGALESAGDEIYLSCACLSLIGSTSEILYMCRWHNSRVGQNISVTLDFVHGD
jgi:hypothetical protein